MTPKLLGRAVLALAVVQVVVISLMVVGFVGISNVATKQTHDESSTCHIQARGLPAGHALAAVISDLHFLVAQPLSPQAKQRIDALPPETRRLLLARYRDLGVASRIYSVIESKQPASRTC